MKIKHSIIGEVSIEEIKMLALKHQVPYPHSVIVALCNKLLEIDGKTTKLIGDIDERMAMIKKNLKSRTEDVK